MTSIRLTKKNGKKFVAKGFILLDESRKWHYSREYKRFHAAMKIRVLRHGGFLIFKWNETDIKTSEVLKLTTQKPIFGIKCGKREKTHWIVFMKK